MLKRYFTLEGYDVITAAGGSEALQKLAKQPDLILLDINMPDIDGLSLCKNIRDFVSCPILFLTANVEDSDKIKGFGAGGDDYIVKPFSIDELGARVSAHLRRENRSKTKSRVWFDEQLAIDYFADDEAEKYFVVGGKEITAKLLAEALRSLPEEKREAVLLYYFFDMSETEIAKLNNIPRTTVRYRRTSSFELLKRYLEERAYDCTDW